jgi:iron complex transport system substrate-binding protein
MNGRDVYERSISRRRMLAAGSGIVLAGLCARRANAAAGTPVSSPAADFPRTIAHAMGETIVPARPERVACTGDFIDLDFLLALDIEPVLYGFTNAWSSGAMPWQTAAADLPSFDAAGELDLEAIVIAHPDLIVAMPSDGAGYERLSEIAPTIVLGWDTEWRSGLRTVADALGLEHVADARIATAESLIAEGRRTLEPISTKRLMVGFQYGDTFYIWGDQTPAAKLFIELGLNVVGGPEPILTATSLEQVILLEDAEILLSVASDPEGIAMQEASPLFRSLPAVQNGGYEVLTVVQARALGDGLSPISMPWVMPRFIELMTRVAGGGGKRLG